MESSSVAQHKIIVVTSHESSLRRCLEEFQSSEETMLPSAQPLWYRWAAIAALGMVIIAAVTFMSWWAGDTSSRVNKNMLTVGERTNARHDTSDGAASMIIAGPELGPMFPELYFPKPESQGCEQLASVFQAIELEHFQPKFPSYTMGGSIDKVYVVGSPQSATVDITYSSGMVFRATSVGGSRPDLTQSIQRARQEGYLLPDEMPYLVAISDTKGLMWPGAYDSQTRQTTSPSITWWDNGITYDLTTGKHVFTGDDSEAIWELKKIAESFSGHTRVPSAGERINIPPSYIDFQTAVEVAGFSFRVPKYTAGGVVTDVYKRIKDGFAYYDYSNHLSIAADAGGKEPHDSVSTYKSYEEAVAAYRKGGPEIEQAGIEAVPVDIAGNRGILIVRKDRKTRTPPDFTGLPIEVLPSLLWWEGKATYSLAVDDERFFEPDSAVGIQEMLKIARSMYE